MLYEFEDFNKLQTIIFEDLESGRERSCLAKALSQSEIKTSDHAGHDWS
jgi:hypothetical protein